MSGAAGLKGGQSNRKRDFDFAEFIKKQISNHEYKYCKNMDSDGDFLVGYDGLSGAKQLSREFIQGTGKLLTIPKPRFIHFCLLDSIYRHP